MDNPIRSREILRSYRLTWLQMRVNVLDKSMWENLKPFRNNNPPHLHSLWWYSNYSDYHSIMGANIENLRKFNQWSRTRVFTIEIRRNEGSFRQTTQSKK